VSKADKLLTMPKFFPVSCHTKTVGLGSTFVAIKGDKEDGVAYISAALKQGAKKIIVHQDAKLSKEIISEVKSVGATIEKVQNTRKALAQLSAQANDNPSKKLKIVGVTGTKGKTSTVFMLEHLLRSAGYKTALLSTVHNKIFDTVFETELTTAHPDYLHAFFALCVKQGVEYVVMEVAAQALSLHRIEGITFDGAIFTNFGQEHAEFYETQENYFAAKCKIFDHLKTGAPVFVNADDERGKEILNLYPEFFSFSLTQENVTLSARPIELIENLSCSICFEKKCILFSCPHLFGAFNAYNMLGAVSLAHVLGVPLEMSAHAMNSFSKIPGRLERYVLPNGSFCFIDHAHNPSSFEAVLSTLRKMTDQLIVVFGAGGERDGTKRPQMGKISAHYADHIILTSDNPRSENPVDIAADICVGVETEHRGKILCELDREKAIQAAYRLAKKNGIIALLGKGRDEYQIFGTKKRFFSEREILKNF